MQQIKPGDLVDGYVFQGGDYSQKNNWRRAEPKQGQELDGYVFKGGDPSLPDSWLKKDAPRGAFGVVNDNVIEVANAAAGGVKAVSDFISPGNRVSKAIEGFIQSGEESQSDQVKASKLQFQAKLANAIDAGEEIGAVLDYVVDSPLLAVSQAIGSFAVPGGAVKGAGLIAGALGGGQKAVQLAGRAGGVTAGAAMGGGDAAGSAYDAVMDTPIEIISAVPEFAQLVEAGKSEDEAKQELATKAARKAAVLPALLGGAFGAVGVEKLLAGAGGYTGGVAARALKGFVSEGAQEAVEEGVTQFEGNRAAAEYNPEIDPFKGVAGAATMGAVTGGVMGGGVSALTSPVELISKAKTADEAIEAAIAAQDIGIVVQPKTAYVPGEGNQEATARIESAAQGVQVQPDPVQQRLESAAAAGARLPNNPVNKKIGEIQLAIAARGGVATPSEASFLERYGAGKPYDRVATPEELNVPAPKAKIEAPVSESILVDGVSNSRGSVKVGAVEPSAFQYDQVAQGKKRVEPVPVSRVDTFIEQQRNTNTPAAQMLVSQFERGQITREQIEQDLDTKANIANQRVLTPDPVQARLESAARAGAQGVTTPALGIVVESGFRRKNPITEKIKAMQAAIAERGGEPTEAEVSFLKRYEAFAPAMVPTSMSVPQTTQSDVASPEPAQPAAANKDWEVFTPDSGTLNVPRAEMPQVKAENRGAMVNFLNARGVAHQQEQVSADSLKPTQAEFSREKVEKAKQFEGGDRSILVSGDGYVVDGHHQWLAKKEKGEPVKVIRLDAPIADLLPLVREFPSSTLDESSAFQTQAEAAPAIPVPPTAPAAETMLPAQPALSAREVQEQAEIRRQAEKKEQRKAARAVEKTPMALSVGMTPNSAEPVTVKEGVIYIGDEPAQDFETGDDVIVAEDATPEQIRDALKAAGAVGNRVKFFGLNNAGQDKTKDSGTEIPINESEVDPGTGEENQPQAATSVAITDLGEKIGGARKDLAASGFRASTTKNKDDRPTWARRFEVSQIVAGDGAGRWVMRDSRNKDWMGQARQVGGSQNTFASEQDALDAIPLAAVSLKHRAIPTGSIGADGEYTYEIWRDVTDRKRVKVVDQVFPSRVAAMEYMAKNAQSILETSTTFGEANLPTPDRTDRTGVARRNGDVEGGDFMKTFGLRGVEFGNWNNQSERQEVMNAAYDGLLDLAEVVGIPPKAIGLNGDLALAFGARGQGLSSAKAHYERERAVINLTKMNGAGALAHEWFHALDHYFGRQDGKAASQWKINKDGTRSFDIRGAENDMASGGFSRRDSGVREELRDAYKSLMETMFSKAEQYVEDTTKADQFVARSREDVAQRLDRLRADLSEQKDPRYYKRNNKPASAEQLAEFDTIAKQIVDGESLEVAFVQTPDSKNALGGRWSNEALEKLSAIYKAVRGRSGFDSGKQSGVMDRLRDEMNRYSQRLQMLAQAQAGQKKTKRVPTEFAMDARQLDQGRGQDYWTTPHEMAARAFQGYVEDKIAQQGARSPFLNYAPENFGILTPWGAKRPFPYGEERKAINAAIAKFISVLKTKETDTGVAMFSRSKGFAEKVDMVLDGTLPESEVVGVVRDAPVLTALGMPELPLATTGDRIAKMHYDHGMTRAEIAALEQEVQNPVMVFESDSIPGAKVVLTSMWRDGAPVIAAVRPNVRLKRFEVNLLASAYGKDRIEQLGRWNDAGLLRYFDKQKASAWATIGGVQFPWMVQLQQRLPANVIGPADVVKPTFQRGGGADNSAVVELQALADGITKGWANAPEVVVLDSLSNPATPSAVRRLNEVQKSQGASGEPRAFFYQGKVWLVAGQLKDKKSAAEALFHEALGHYGLRGVFGKALNPVLNDLAKRRPELMQAKAKEYGLDLESNNGRLTAAEEVLAELAETRPEISFVRMAVAALRTWLRNNVGFFDGLKLTNDEIVRNFIVPARDWVRKGRDGGPSIYRGRAISGYPPATAAASTFEALRPTSETIPGSARSVDKQAGSDKPEPSFSRAAITESTEFKRWFGDWKLAQKAIMPRTASGLEDAKNIAQEFVGNEIVNRATKLVGMVSGNNLRKMASQKAGDKSTSMMDHALAIANLDKLFENAVLDHSHPDSKGEPTIRAIHRYIAPMFGVDGGLRAVKLTVKETTGPKEPNPIYTVEAMEIESPPSVLSRANPNETGIRPQAGMNQSVLDMLDEVNRVSKVVDAEGKPIVVYHGTRPGNDITQFETPNNRDGIYFTPDASYAQGFTNDLRGDTGEAGSIYPVYLSVKNPYVVRADDIESDAAQNFLYRGLDRAKLEKQEYDGAMLYLDGELDQVIAFDSKQIKSATGNNGAFDPSNPDIRFSRTADKERASFKVDEPGRLDNVIYKLQDKNVDLKRVSQAITKQTGELEDTINAYQKESLYHGKAAKQSKDFLDKQLKPLLDDMRMRKVNLQEFENYLWNRHAPERNEQIAKVNDRFPDGGSGIKTEDAMRYMKGLPEDKRRHFEALAKRVDQITRDNMQMMVDSGLEKQSTIDSMKGAYKHYVPLLRGESSSYNGRGQGYSIRGATTKRALGSDKPVENIISALADQREKIISRAQKAEVGRALMGLALENPQDDFWFVFDPLLNKDEGQRTRLRDQLETMGLDADLAEEISRQPYTEEMRPNGKAIRRPNRKLTELPNALAVRLNGEDKFIVFNQENERARRMGESLSNLDAPRLEGALGVVGQATRYFASINTQYNPIFGIVNLVRDTQGALLNLTSTKIAGKQAQVVKGILPAIKAIYQISRANRSGGIVNGEWADLYERFQNTGGQTGFRDMFSTPKERTEKQLKEALDPTALQKVYSNTAKPLFDWLSDYNETLENGVRLSAFKAALDSGLSDEQAASLAKELTVNFNRKGQIGTQMGAVYAFFNASTQGTARMLEALKGPKGKQIIAGGMLLGAAQTILLGMAGFDDEDPPEFVREKNLIFPTGGGKYITIPMPLGLHVLPNVGRIITEQLMGRTQKGVTESMAGLFKVMIDSFNPVGSSTLMQTIAPTVLDPMVALSENTDFTGRNIAREDFNPSKPTPGYTRTKANSIESLVAVSRALNYLSGGSDYTKGLISPTPDQLEYVISQLTGGVGREISKIVQVGETSVTGEELPPYKVPLFGRFYGNTTSQSSQAGQFYENLRAMNDHKLEIKGRLEDGLSTMDYIKDNPEAMIFRQAESVERRIQELGRTKRKLKENGAGPESIKQVEEAITRVMSNFNERVKQMRGVEAG
jgi:hypothetical protein